MLTSIYYLPVLLDHLVSQIHLDYPGYPSLLPGLGRLWVLEGLVDPREIFKYIIFESHQPLLLVTCPHVNDWSH